MKVFVAFVLTLIALANCEPNQPEVAPAVQPQPRAARQFGGVVPVTKTVPLVKTVGTPFTYPYPVLGTNPFYGAHSVYAPQTAAPLVKTVSPLTYPYPVLGTNPFYGAHSVYAPQKPAPLVKTVGTPLTYPYPVLGTNPFYGAHSVYAPQIAAPLVKTVSPLTYPYPVLGTNPFYGDSDCDSLFNKINAERVRYGRSRLRCNINLQYTAYRHTVNQNANEHRFGTCNAHSWFSPTGDNAKACCYREGSSGDCMWDKPSEVTDNTDKGYEITHYRSNGATADSAYKSFIGSSYHGAVALGYTDPKGNNWSGLKEMGCWAAGKYANCWFAK